MDMGHGRWAGKGNECPSFDERREREGEMEGEREKREEKKARARAEIAVWVGFGREV